jgi:hypothetical protein
MAELRLATATYRKQFTAPAAPEPVDQRLLGWWELSVRTAIRLSRAPKFR